MSRLPLMLLTLVVAACSRIIRFKSVTPGI